MRDSDHAACQSATLQLPDRRRLGYLRCGAERGRSFFYFHGMPGSRYEAMLIDEVARALDLSITAVDRPGYGASDFSGERQLSDWPDDILVLADALGMETFGIIGVSGGGPYALACAYQLAERLTSIGIICGLGPVYEADLLRDMSAFSRLAFYLADGHADLFGWLYGRPLQWLAKARPALLVDMLAYYNGGADKPVLLRPDIQKHIAQSLPHAFQQGVAASIQDIQLYQRPWGFELSNVRKQVLLWHGTSDTVVPCSHSVYMHSRLPKSVLKLVPQERHFSLPVLHANDILTALCEVA